MKNKRNKKRTTYTAEQIHSLQNAVLEEMRYCNKNNIPLSKGKIGVENLFNETPYAYASKGEYSNMATYWEYKKAFKIVRKHIHMIV